MRRAVLDDGRHIGLIFTISSSNGNVLCCNAACTPGEQKMSRIARLMPPNNVVISLSATSKKRLFEQAGLLFENNHGIERGKVFDSLFARERLGSTGLGAGVAIPHGRIKGLKEAVAAVVRLTDPIPFDSPDGQPVRLVVFLLVPEHATEEHLELLSELAELLSDRSIRDTLMNSEDPAQVHRILATWAPYRPAA
jgi:PTS system nitrogen regulatory IIA component